MNMKTHVPPPEVEAVTDSKAEALYRKATEHLDEEVFEHFARKGKDVKIIHTELPRKEGRKPGEPLPVAEILERIKKAEQNDGNVIHLRSKRDPLQEGPPPPPKEAVIIDDLVRDQPEMTDERRELLDNLSKMYVDKLHGKS